MSTATRPSTAPVRYMQGVAVPAESVRPTEFFSRTRRHTNLEQQFGFNDASVNHTVPLRKADILAGLLVKVFATVTVAGGGTVTSKHRWPYDLIRQWRFTANGASNIINCSGLQLKARDIMKRSDLTDRGVVPVAGAPNQGTLALAEDAWGFEPGKTVTNGTYDVELAYWVPVAEDEHDLAGAIFLATSTSDLTLQLDFANKSELFAVAGGSTVTYSGTVQVTSTKFSIPIGGDGQIVVPDLSVFHSLISSRVATGIQTGENELRIIGQGAGKSLLRMYFQVLNDGVPLVMNRANFGRQSWRYANNETPDEFIDGSHLAWDMERRYNSAIGKYHGFGCHDFAHENAFRDAVDMGTTSELRLVTTINQGVVLTNPAVEYVTETIFAAGQGV